MAIKEPARGSGRRSSRASSKRALLEEIEELEARVNMLRAQLPSSSKATSSDTSGGKQKAGSAASRRKPGAAETASITTRTGGGSVIHGSVVLSNGHFIGRDAIFEIKKLVVQGYSVEQTELALASYLEALSLDLAGLRLGDIDGSADHTRQEPLELPDIYVPLDIAFQRPAGVSLVDAVEARDPGELLMLGRAVGKEYRHSLNRPEHDSVEEGVSLIQVSALEALCTFPRLTLLGPPGSGKSTFGAYVLLALAQSWQGRAPVAQSLGKGWTFGNLLPVRVILRQFAEQFAAGDQKPTAGDLWSFIGEDLQRRGWGEAAVAMPAVQSLARQRGALVLFDGLDECGDEDRRRRVLAAVQAFVASAGTRTRFLVTARPYAYPDGARPAEAIFELASLDDAKIEQFIVRWYDAVARHRWALRDQPELMRDDLLAAYGRPELRPLAGNPLLLTLMAVLHSNRGRLPDDRADLYGETVELLLQRWNQDVGADRALLNLLNVPGLSMRNVQTALERLAFDVHEANEGRDGLADIPQGALLRAFKPIAGGSLDKAEAVVGFIERRAGLLVGQGGPEGQEPKFTFPHRTFQEFLSAQHLKDQAKFPSLCLQLADRAPYHWREVLTLAGRLAGPDRGAGAADELIGASDPPSFAKSTLNDPGCWTRVILAGRMLSEIGPVQLHQFRTSQAVAQRVQRWMLAGLSLLRTRGGAPARQRAEMGDVLAALGDPRFDTDRYHLPADDSMLGFVRVNSWPSLAMARYPVTVAQFAAYMRATAQVPKEPECLMDSSNRPVRWVNYNDAQGYARWLTESMRNDPALSTTAAGELVRNQGWRVDLPDDSEWEAWALSGLAGRRYPWGDFHDSDRANTAECEVGDSSSVGCFPPNDWGIYDICGNVLEWTRSSMPGNNTTRSVRGGSFAESLRDAGSSARGWTSRDSRADILGFRLVLRSGLKAKPR